MLHIETEEKNNVISIHIRGEFNLHNLSEIESAWEESLKKKPRMIGFDFSLIKEIDSMGISHLVKFSKRSIMEGIDVMLYGLSDEHKKFFELAGVDRFFNILTKQQFDDLGAD